MKQPTLLAFQFSLRTLLLMIAIIGVSFAYGPYLALLFFVLYVITCMLRNRMWIRAGAILGVMLVLPLFGVGVYTQVRLDTGDQRDVIWGVPLIYRRMPESARNALLSLTNSQAPGHWCRCASRVPHYDPAGRLHWMYRVAAAWVDVDPLVANHVVRDLAAYLEATHAIDGHPECYEMLQLGVLARTSGDPRISDQWRCMPEVQDYLRRKAIKATINVDVLPQAKNLLSDEIQTNVLPQR